MRRDKKDCLAAKASYEHACQAEYEDAIKRPRPETWPARMPAYAGTVLCPDRRYREMDGGDADAGEKKRYETQ